MATGYSDNSGNWRTPADQAQNAGLSNFPDQQTAVAADAGTTVATDSARNQYLWLTPAGAIAAHTVTFPSNATSRLGQMQYVGSSQAITAVTFNGSTILNPPAGFGANEMYQFMKVTATQWARVI